MDKNTAVLKAGFLILLTASSALSLRLTSYVNRAIKERVESIISKAEEQTGIKVHYAHLSPAILWNINMTDLTLQGAENGEEIVSVRRITLRYSLYRILKGDMDRAFSTLLINGVDINIDKQRDSSLFSKLSAPLKKDLPSGTDGPSPNYLPIANVVRSVTQKLYTSVSMKKVAVHYKDSDKDAAMSFSRITLRRSRRESSLRLMATGDASFQTAQSPLLQNTLLTTAGSPRAAADGGVSRGGTLDNGGKASTLLSARFTSDVTLRIDIDGSQAILRLRDLAAQNIAVRSVNLLTRYSNGVVTMQTIQTPLPLKAKCVIDANEKTLQANVQTAKLPIRRVFSPRKDTEFDAALDTEVTMDSEVTLGFAEGAKEGGAANQIGYHSMGFFTLPEKFTKSGDIAVEYSLMGDEKAVRISHLKVNGQMFDVDGNVSYAFLPMQLTGTLNVNNVTLPNGMEVSGELLLDSLPPNQGVVQKGLAIFSPEIAIANTALNALEVKIMPLWKSGKGILDWDSIDFSAEAYDYSHIASDGGEENTEPGSIMISGSCLSDSQTKEKSVLASVVIGQYYLDSLIRLTGNEEVINKAFPAANGVYLLTGSNSSAAQEAVRRRLHELMFAGEAYVSYNKDGLSYNVPYALLANTKRENEALYLSLDGSNDIINVSQLDIAYGKYGANLTAHLERAPDVGGVFFTLEAISAMGIEANTVTAVPYHFSGSISGSSIERYITVSDEYGSLLHAVVRGGEIDSPKVEGNLTMSSFPIRAGEALISISAESNFTWNRADGIAANIARFETVGEGIMNSSDGPPPRFALSGQVTKYGAFFDSVSYTDSFSALNGSAAMFLNMNNGIFDSAKVDFNLSSPVSGESISLTSEVTNPDALPLTMENAMESFYFNAAAKLNSFALSRFVKEKSDNNTLSAAIDATGTFTNPYLNVNVSRASVMFASVPIVASGNASLIDKVLTITDTTVRYGEVSITDVSADLSAETFTGTAKAMLDIGLDKRLFSMPMTFAMLDSDVSPVTHLPLSFTVAMETSGATGTFINEPLPFSITVMRSEGATAIFTSDNLGISGYLVDGGEVNITSESDFLGFHISGKNDLENLDFNINGIRINIASIASRFNDDKFELYHGILTGDLSVKGIKSDPDFNGALAIENADFSLLKVVPYHITGSKIPIIAQHSQIDIVETPLAESGKTVYLSGKVLLDRWRFDNLELYVRTPAGRTAPALLDVGVATFKGDASIDLTVAIDRNKNLDVTGNVYVQSTRANVRAREVMNFSDMAKSEIFSRRIDVDITMGPHVNVTLDPLLRALLTPGSVVNFQMDEAADTFSLKGDVGIKSGDIAWFNRSFYLKKGTIRFNDNEESFDPVVTIRAETRDKDDEGKDVKITMTANNQNISRFSPKFSSVPVKSEAELRAMLGQIAVGDSEAASDVMLSMGDFAVAATVGRKIENAIRDLFNFDIFSIRTTALQNVLKNSMNTEQGDRKITAGNLLDNSTVYIGKYIGSVVYLDAMLHLSYDEHRKDDVGTRDGISFQPEVGFELEAPFAGIRWSMAPDIDAMRQNMFMPTTSVTLSWGFSF